MSKRPRARRAIKLPPGVHPVVSRGRLYLYYVFARGTQFEGPHIALPNDPNTPQFWTAYWQARGTSGDTTPADTVGALCDAFEADWPNLPRPLAASTQKQYRRQLRRAKAAWGALKARGLRPANVRNAMAQMSRGTANCFLGTMHALSRWALGKELIGVSFTAGVEPYASNGGHIPWSAEMVACAYEHLEGAVRKGVMLELNTGQRGSDMLKLRPSMIVYEQRMAGFDLGWRGQQKTGVRPWMPIFPELAQEMATWDHPKDEPFVPYVRRPSGKPYSRDDFGRDFREAVEKLSARGITALNGATLHGLRGTACVRLRSAGYPDGVIADMVGMSVKMVAHYTRFADKKASTRAAVLAISGRSGTARKAEAR